MNPNQKNHHHLISGEIVFQQEGEEGIASIRCNGVLIADTRDLPVRLMGKAQQILQVNFHNRMKGQKIQVLDVVLMNFTYLGHMTQEEFNQPPQGTKLQEKTQPVPDLETAIAEAETQSSNSVPANPR